MMNFRQMLSNNMSLESFIGDAVQWSPNEWKNFTDEWKYRDVCKMLPKYRNQIDNVLNGSALDPFKHSIPYSYLLGFKSSEKMDDLAFVTQYLKQIRRFIYKCSPSQIVLFPRPFNDALRIYVDFMKREKNYFGLIPLLRRCIIVLSGNDINNRNMLTFAHCDLMYCCVQTYCYHLAAPEINHDIIQVQGDGCIKSIDNLRYFYYSALIHIGLKNLRLAQECLTMVCTSPSESLSLIQIDAYKKYILISLIRRQHLVSLPRYTPRLLTRYFPKFCSEYLELNQVFDSKANSDQSLTLDKLNVIITRNLDVYTKDKNYGLVKQVVLSVEKNNVKKLTSIYTKLSIKKVTNLCNFNSIQKAKDIIIKMIDNGDLSASISYDNVVTFYDNRVTKSDYEMLQLIQSGIKNTLNLWNGLDWQQLKIKQSKQFVRKSLNLPSISHDANDIQSQMLFSQVMGMGGGGFFRHGGL